MKLRLRRLLCLLLCAVLCLVCIPSGSAAATTMLTAINDSFLPLSASTMPVRVGGTQYVPYSVFTGTLGVSASYSSADQSLTLSAGATSLLFQLDRGTVYDQNMTSYNTPAYSMNGTVYVPVKLVCGKFGLTYSNISAAAPILRICNDNASQSDSAFVSSSAATIRRILDNYNGNAATSKPSTNSQTTTTTVDPVTGEPVEQPTVKPNTAYLTYLGTPGKNTREILDALASAGISATFFLTTDGTPLDGDLLREIVGRGHAVGFLLLSSAQDMTGKLRAANDVLFRETGTVSHLLCISDGSAKLSAAQREGLSAAGFRVWDAALDSRDHSLGAAQTAQNVIDACGRTSGTVVIRMGHYGSTARATASIAAYLNQNAVPTAVASLPRTPITQS